MNDKEMFNFYQTHYYHEIDAREKFNTRMQIPVAIFATEFSIIAYFLKTSKIMIDDFFAACCFGFTIFFAFMAIGAAYQLWKSESGKGLSPKHLILFIVYLCLMVVAIHQHKAITSVYLYHLLGFIITSVILMIPSIYYFIRLALSFSQSEPDFSSFSGIGPCIKKPREYSTQIKATIEAVLDFTQIATGIFGKLESMVRTGNSSFNITQHSIDPCKAAHTSAFTFFANNMRFM